MSAMALKDSAAAEILFDSLVSAAHDGTMRVWDLALAADGDRTPEVCYGLGGYKVWLGSVCVDDKRLISDGSDNTVVVHDFSKSD